jgi:cell cycle checkpoint protein
MLDKALFTSYTLNLGPYAEGEKADLPGFQINLPALLETLQIFGAVDIASRAQKAEQDSYRSNLRNYRPDAFSNQTLGISGTCSLLYAEEGAPFSIVIEEAGVKTTANLRTYVPESPEDIPFDPQDLAFKVIMEARLLLDSLSELAPMGPKRLTITAKGSEPYLAMTGLGEVGTSSVSFSKKKEHFMKFDINERWSQTYNYDLIKWSNEAMRIASEVVVRGDWQGVMSMQFKVEIEGGGISFVAFTFVPYITHEDDDEQDEVAEEDAEEQGVEGG